MKRSIGAKTLLAAVPVLVVGSYNEKDEPNLMTCAWGGICSSKPPYFKITIPKKNKNRLRILRHLI